MNSALPPLFAAGSGSAPSLIFRPDSILEPIPVSELFARAAPIEVDLGSGDGSFLTRYAAARTDLNLLGVERLLGRLRKTERKCRRAALGNVRLVRIEAGYLIEHLLPPGALAAIHVYFPDPWPKRKHWKNRLVNARFGEACARVLAPGGRIYLRTDDAPYHAQMLEVFGGSREFIAVETPAPLRQIPTDFEGEFGARGVATRHAAYERAAGGAFR